MPENTHSQFDTLSRLYEDMASWPFRKEIETPSVLEALGDVRGQDVLDFGCGDGTYSRILKRLGARRVVGFDEAEGMLAHGRQRESEQAAGIEYVNQLSDDLAGSFDVVLGVYVLPYAADKAALDRMCAAMGRLLKPGGRLVTLPIHPDFDPDPQYYAQYGFAMTQQPAHREGGDIRLDLFQGDFQASVTAWYWSFDALYDALARAGFTHITHKNPLPARYDGPGQASAPAALRPYLSRPHAVILQAGYQP